MNEQQLREHSDEAYLEFMSKGMQSKEPGRVLTAKEHPTTLGPRLEMNKGTGMHRPQARDSAFSTLARNTLDFLISPAEASEMSQETRNYWNDPRVRKLAASRFTDSIDSIRFTPSIAKAEPMYYPPSYSEVESRYFKRMATESFAKGAAKIADLPFELADGYQLISDLSPLKKHGLSPFLSFAPTPFLALEVFSFAERHDIFNRPSATIFNLLEHHGIDLNLASPRNTTESFIAGGFEALGGVIGTCVAAVGCKILTAGAGQFSKVYQNLGGFRFKPARFEQQKISEHLVEYAERVFEVSRRDIITEISPGFFKHEIIPNQIDTLISFKKFKDNFEGLHHASSAINKIPLKDLQITHGLNYSKKAFKKLTDSVQKIGIQKPIEYTEYEGVKYILNGHHRFFAARKLNIQEVPAVFVKLPYKDYKKIEDLMFYGTWH